MPITQEELNSPVRETRAFLMFEEGNPNTFAMIMQFPTGKSHLWMFEGPHFPITEPWLREAHAKLMERIVSELKEGNPHTRPPMRPDEGSFRATNWTSATAVVRGVLEQWVERRKGWAAANAKQIWLPPGAEL